MTCNQQSEKPNSTSQAGGSVLPAFEQPILAALRQVLNLPSGLSPDGDSLLGGSGQQFSNAHQLEELQETVGLLLQKIEQAQTGKVIPPSVITNWFSPKQLPPQKNLPMVYFVTEHSFPEAKVGVFRQGKFYRLSENGEKPETIFDQTPLNQIRDFAYWANYEEVLQCSWHTVEEQPLTENRALLLLRADQTAAVGVYRQGKFYCCCDRNEPPFEEEIEITDFDYWVEFQPPAEWRNYF